MQSSGEDSTQDGDLTASGRIEALDGLRGLAILAVIVVHTYGVGVFSSDTIPWKILRAGWVGVDLFFVLSGFLITRILLASRGRRGYFRVFFTRRILRIFPAYYAILFAMVLLGRFIPDLSGESYERLIQNLKWLLTYTTNIAMTIDDRPFRFGMFKSCFDTAHFWSLAVEEQFYLLWPFVVAFTPIRKLKWVVAGIIVAGPLLRYFAMNHHYATGAYVLMPCRMDTLAFGAAIAIIERAGYLSRLRRVAPAVALLSFVAALAIAMLRNKYINMDPVVLVAGYSVNACGFAGLVASVVSGAGQARRIFSAAWLRFLGKYSYGIYIVHLPIAGIVLPAVRNGQIVSSQFVSFTVCFVWTTAASIAIAYVMWHTLEKHMLALKRYASFGSAPLPVVAPLAALQPPTTRPES